MSNKRLLVLLLATACTPDMVPADRDPTPGDDSPPADGGVDPSPDSPTPDTTPMFQLDPSEFKILDDVWWTDSVYTTLKGTITASDMTSIAATLNGVEYQGVISGSTFTINLGDHSIPGRATASITATSRTGLSQTVLQKFGMDLTPPAITTTAGSTVRDEAMDTITYPSTANRVPRHQHGGATIALNTAGCVVVNKYSYLLDAASTLETSANPITYDLTASDESIGVGLEPTLEYQVGLRSSGGTQWLGGWKSAGTPTSSAAGLAITKELHREGGAFTVEGTYAVQFRATDKLGRTNLVERCISLHLLAPPVWFGPRDSFGTGYVSANHSYSMPTMKLEAGSTFSNFSTSVLAAKGASIYDLVVENGTPDPATITVQLAAPTTATVAKRFVKYGFKYSTIAVNKECAFTPSNCASPFVAPAGEIASSTTNAPIATRIAMFEWLGSMVGTEIPGTKTGTNYRFQLPAYTGTPRLFVIMTLVSSIDALAPQDAAHPESSFSESYLGLTSIKITGHVYPGSVGCSVRKFDTSGNPSSCTEEATIQPYLALTYANVQLAASTMLYSVAATPNSIASSPFSKLAPAGTYMNTTEQQLPNWGGQAAPF